MLSLLLATEDPLIPQDAKSMALVAATAFIAGVTPHLISMLKAWRAEQRADEATEKTDHRQLITDLRSERAEIKAEMISLRAEHLACEKIAAAQEQQIRALTNTVGQHAERIVELTNKLDASQKDRDSMRAEIRTLKESNK